MEASAPAPSSKLSSSSVYRANPEVCCSSSTSWVSNGQHPQSSTTQSSLRCQSDMVEPKTRTPVNESVIGLPVPFHQDVTTELVSNPSPQYSPYAENASNNKSASTAIPQQGLLLGSGSTVNDALSLSESLNKIHHLALNTSLSLDACCPSDMKLTRGMQLSSHNLATLSSVSTSSENGFTGGTNAVQSSFLPRQVDQQFTSNKVEEQQSVVKVSNTEQSDTSRSQDESVVSSCCGCKQSMATNVPGTELSLAIASVIDNGAEQETVVSHPYVSAFNNNNNNPQAAVDNNVEKSVSRKDDMYFKLVQQVRELEIQLKERKEWAQQKAVQAASKFSKDMAELKSLRLEHEEILRLKRDTQALEDSTMKRLTEMESALRKAGAQVDRANATVRKLETENAELRAEMEAAKLSAAESNAKCQEVAKREKKSSKKIQAWEKQKAKMLDELVKQKQQIAQAQEQLLEVRRQQQEAEMRWRQEEKAKDEALLLANREKWNKEQLELAAKRKEESWSRKADADLQRHKDDIKRLEDELEQLRVASESGNATQGSGIVSHSTDISGLQALKETSSRLLCELAELQDSRGDIRRDRECVMCMSEESSVVFLPCAHQIVCVKCNDLHKNQGMMDCPSCRTIIQERIQVFGVRSP